MVLENQHLLRLKTILQYRYIAFIILILVLIISFIRLIIPEKIKTDINETEISGILIDYKIVDDKLTLIIKGKDKIRCTYYLKEEEIINLKLGIKLKVYGKLSIPSNNTIPNTFNYKEYLKNNNIAYIINVEKIQVINNKEPFIYRIKNALIEYIKKFKANAYLQMFIIGNKEYLDEDIYSTYQELGVSHIFAISGMHVSLLASIIFKLLFKLKDNYKYYIIIIFLIFYAFITSFQASILRSISLYICLFINKRFSLNLSNISVFYIAIAILLIINPKLIFNIGFLYSSITSFSLIKYSYLIKGNYIKKCLIISLIAFLFSLPLTVNNNFEINILSIFNNLIFVPLISFVIYPLCIITLILPFFEVILIHLISMTELISNYLFIYNIVIPKLNIVSIIIYYLLLNVFLISFEKKYLLFIIILLTTIKLYPYIDRTYYINYFDVSQGDSIMIKYKSKVILIDTGGKVSNFNNTYNYTDSTIKYLKSIGISTIDSLIISHGDYDHSGESINLINNIKVKKVIFNCGEFNELEQELIKALDKNKIPYYSCIKELNIDDNKLYFLKIKDYGNENDDSNVIYTKLNGYKFIFMGDAGVEVENDLIYKYKLKNIDVLKVGHHGSKTSSSKNFIDEIEPKYSIISVGKNNRYGHPNDSVIDNLEQSKIYRTDQDGSVMFQIKNNKLKIETCSP